MVSSVCFGNTDCGTLSPRTNERECDAGSRHTFYKQAYTIANWRAGPECKSRETAMATQVKPVPDGYHTLTPYLVVDGADKVISFMKEAFGAKAVLEPMMRADGKIMHAEFKIGDSVVMISDASERAK